MRCSLILTDDKKKKKKYEKSIGSVCDPHFVMWTTKGLEWATEKNGNVLTVLIDY